MTHRHDAWRAFDRLGSAFKALGPAHEEWWKKNWPLVGAGVARGLGHTLPKVNDTISMSGRGSKKRFIVVFVKGTVGEAVANSGGEKGSLLRFDALNYPIEILRLKPMWTSKEAQARYDDYVKYMTRFKNEALIAPFSTSEELRPEEEEGPPPTSDADPYVTIRHTPQEGTVAIFPKNREVYDILRRYGFNWAPRDKVVRRTQSVGLPKTTAPLHAIQGALHRAGIKVAFELTRAESREEIEAAHERRREHMRGRAEMIRERAIKAGERAQKFAERAGQGADKVLAKLDIEGYFPTPPDIAKRVIEEADIEDGDAVLEPSAGAGALADLARLVGGEVDTVEIDPRLIRYLQSLGYPVVALNILNLHAGPIYDRVVMNPPFEHGQDIEHVQHAYKLLKPGGRLVAIMSEGPFFRQDKKATAFRAWLETKGHTAEKLPPTQFGRATVSTRLVVIDKQEDETGPEDTFPLDEAQVRAIGHARANTEGETKRAAEIAQELIEKSATSRRAKRSLETAKRKAKEEAQYAADLTRRAGNIEAAIERVGVERAKPKRRTDIAKGDRVVARDRWGSQSYIGTITRVHKDTAVLVTIPNDVDPQHPDEGGKEHKVFLRDVKKLSDLADIPAYAKYLEAPAAERVLSPARQLAENIRRRIKRDLGATLVRTDQNGFYVGFGNVTETWAGKRAEREYKLRIWGGGSSYGAGSNKPQRHIIEVGHRPRGGGPDQEFEVDFTDLDGDQAYAAFVAALRPRL